jgi:hypothetical protein
MINWHLFSLQSRYILHQANGHRVMTVSPRYDQYKDAWDTDVIVEVYIFHSAYTYTLIRFHFFRFQEILLKNIQN